jgi:hypothetical protein
MTIHEDEVSISYLTSFGQYKRTANNRPQTYKSLEQHGASEPENWAAKKSLVRKDAVEN